MTKKIILIFITFVVLINLTGCANDMVIPNNKTTESKDKIIEETVVNETVDQTPTVEVVEESISIPLNQIENVETNVIVNNEQDIINYATNLKSETDNYLNSEDVNNFKEVIAKNFIIITDFIFYDTEIGGIKFNDLTNETKTKILEIANYLDERIESKFPNYKLELKEKYNIASSYIKEKFNYFSNIISTKIKENVSSETINNFEEAGEDIKEAVSTTGEIISVSYDKTKEVVSNWYQKLKNKY